MKQLRYVVSLAFVGAALTIVPAVQQAAAGDAPAPAPVVREPSLVQKVREGARGSVKVSTSKATGKASLVRAGANGDLYPSSDAHPRAKAEAFLKQYSRAFGAPSRQLVRAGATKDGLGYKHFTYTQRYRGIPVYGSMLKVHVDKRGNLTSVNGALVPVRNLDLARTLGPRAAAAKAVAAVRAQPPTAGASVKGVRAASSQLVVYRHGLIQGVDKGRTELAYQVEVTNKKNIREMVFVTADDGKVVNRYSVSQDALDRELYEAKLKPNGDILFSKVWEEGKPTNKLNASQLNIVESSGESYWLFRNAFGRDSYDGLGHTMTTINNDPRIQCPNANWNGFTTNYCDGSSADDTVAHEWGHAYTEYTSGLIYQWQPGAMNEAYSDIWGETVDLLNDRQDDEEGDLTTPREDGQCSTHTAALAQLTINSPSTIAKICQTGGASFGAQLTPTGITGDVALALDAAEPADATLPAGTTTDGCSPYTNADAVAGKIVMVDRGRCTFAEKAQVATTAGATALIIGNRDDAVFLMPGDDPGGLVPTVMITVSDRELIRTTVTAGQTVNVTMKDAAPQRADSYRWLMFEDDDGGASRDMWTPTCLGQPGKVSDAEYYCAADDQGGVHSNSGVVNHSYALLVDGGTYNGVTVQGIGLDKAAAIYFRAQSTKLVLNSGFPELADALETSCGELALAGEPIKELSTDPNDSVDSPDLITSADCAQVSAAAAAVELRTDPTSQCGFQPQFASGDPAFTCGAGTTPTTLFAEDFEGDAGENIAGWDPGLPTVPAGGTSQPWAATADLPGDHTGTAAFGPDPDVHCALENPLSADFLASGNIAVPASVVSPRLSFDHYVATEVDFDGGNVQLSVNGGPFTAIPAAAYTFNAPSPLLGPDDNDNPLAGQPAFHGTDGGTVRGSWVTSQVSLSAAGVAPGDTVQLRLAMGRDQCTGNDGWYVDNIEVLACAPGGPSPSVPPTATATATATGTATSTATPTTTPPAVKVGTTTKVRKPSDAPAYKADFKVRVKVLADTLTPGGRVVIKYKGVTIAKGKLVDGKVKITIKKNLTVGKHKLVAKYQGSSTAKPSKKVFTVKIVE